MPVACGGPSELLTRVPAQSAVEKIAPSKPPKKRRFMVTSGFGETKPLNHAAAGRGKSSAALRRGAAGWTRPRRAGPVVSRGPDRARRSRRLQDAAQALVVGAPPEYPPALRAFGEGVQLRPHRLRDAPVHALLRNLAQRRVAHPAAAEGPQRALKLEGAHHLAELPLRLGLAHEVAALHRAALEDPLVPGEDHPLLRRRERDDLLVAIVVFPQAVEAREAQMPRELAQMGIEDETRFAKRRQPQVHHRRDVQTLEHRIDRDAFAAMQHVPEGDRCAVNQHEIHFGVRDPDRFDRVFHRAAAVDGDLERGFAQLRREEVVELLVKPELGEGFCLKIDVWRHDRSALPANYTNRARSIRSTLPPERITPTRLPATGSPRSKRPAAPSAPVGSTTIFIRSHR